MRLIHNQRIDIPTIVAIMIIADRRLRAMSALIGSILRRQGPAVDPKEGVAIDRKMLTTDTSHPR